MSSDLLKEAIADAKAVRETALENAKMALEEAFTPQLKSMLSAKLKEEDLEEDEFYEGEHEDEDEAEEGMHDDDEAEEGRMTAGMHDDEAEEGRHEEDEDDDEVDESNIIEIDGVKYAPVVAEDEEEMGDEEFGGEEEEGELDLEAVIKELEEEEDAEEGDDLEEIANDVSSGIGSGDNKQPATAANDDNQVDPEGEGGEEPEKAAYDEGEDIKESADDVIDLEEVLAALKEEEDTDEEEEVDESAEQINQLSSDLKEHRKVIKFLKGKLNEVNLLNAKLLFTNKLFKNYSLNNSQKMKVVETFDRAGSLREVKLVYSTLAESFNYGNSVSKKGAKIAVTEGKASKPVKSTKPSKKVINEGNELADRFKKLAGIL